MRVSVLGASGYTGGELLRLLLRHPNAEVGSVTSESLAGKPVDTVHPNLRGTGLTFTSAKQPLDCDLLFSCLPHGAFMEKAESFLQTGVRVIDLSADFRLRNPQDYAEWYGHKHACPELLGEAVYGLPELHRAKMRSARLVSGCGCIASSAILALKPIAGMVDTTHVIIDSKIGSSAAGKAPNASTHYTERKGVVRCFAPTGHRHTAEITQETSLHAGLTAHAIGLVRGILSTTHVFLKDGLTEKDVWKAYRNAYGNEPFIRIIKQKEGLYRLPEPKLLNGLNYCDIGFEKDEKSSRLVVLSAIDNLMKGAAGSAVQSMNAMCGFGETLGLEGIGLHPV